MLGPFLMLTVLNCFFMFSSTVTTCALWWQYRKNRHSFSGHDKKLKKSKSYENGILKYESKRPKSANDDCFESKSSMKKREKTDVKTAKKSKRDKKTQLSGVSLKPRSKEAKYECMKTLEKLTSTEDMRHGAMSPSSEAKSTIVMEVSTVQKVVQIFDNDREKSHFPKEKVTYRLTPETEKKVEFVVRCRSEEKTQAMEQN